MKFKTKITTLFAAFSLFVGTIFAFNNNEVVDVKAAEVTPVYDVNSYAIIKPIVDAYNDPVSFYNAIGGLSNGRQVRSIKFTTKLTDEELTNIRSKSGSRIYEVGTIAYGSDGVTEVKTDECYIPTYLVDTGEKTMINGNSVSLYDCIVYSPVEKIYAPASCENLFKKASMNEWESLKSITFENNAFVTTNTTSMRNMFLNFKLDTLDISSFDGSNVTDLSHMFEKSNIKKIIFPTTNFAPNATTTEKMFSQFNSDGVLESYDFLANFDTSNVSSMKEMFSYARPVVKDGVVETLDFSRYTKFSTANVTDMSSMFYNSSFTSIKLDGLDTSKVTNMYSMFMKSHIETISLPENFGSACTNMSSLFNFCENLKTADLTNLNAASAEDMSGMFFYCNNMTTVIFPEDLDTSGVTNMRNMFIYCSSLVTIDLASMDISSGTNTTRMFYGCESLSCIHTSKDTLASDVSVDLPKQFADYAGVSTLNAITEAEQTIDIRIEYFIGRWQALRAAGGEQGMCATLVSGSDEQAELTMLFTMYNESTIEQKNSISTHADVDGVTIGDTMQYLNDVLSGNVKTDGDYGIETTTQTNVVNLSTIGSNVSLIVLISIISVIAISGYYVISKRKHA